MTAEALPVRFHANAAPVGFEILAAYGPQHELAVGHSLPGQRTGVGLASARHAAWNW